MRFKTRWLDRIWLCLITGAFAIGAPIWVLLMAERFGWRMVIGGVVLALVIRYRGSLV